MDRESWQRARAIFEVLVDLSPEGRASGLERQCGDQPEIRREVQALLESHDAAIADSVEPGTSIDRYKIVRPLGSGGMGAVYLAHQSEPITRDVALKVIRDGRYSADLLQRFRAERQALASLNHPHIASVLDAGSAADGRPYFVMEYVPGVPITDYCREHRLDRRERLDLMIKVCDAVQHAHANGIVHRDIKPTNVLVAEQDGKPVPKIIDFGIAKVVDLADSEDTPHTMTGQLLGTPAYMSPEQARGRTVDSRSDLWAIGCLIFEIESGRPTFPRDNLGDTLVAVLSTEVDMSLLPADTPPALRRLIRRCLVKEPELRLASAADARLELLEALTGPAENEIDKTRVRRPGRGLLAWGAAALLAGIAFWLGRPPTAPPAAELPKRKLRFHVAGLSRLARAAPVLSPDGAAFAYVREDKLWVRRFDSLDAAVIAGTEGAEYPFWSPDSRSLGYFARGSIWRVPTGGGERVQVFALRGDVVGGAGAVWTHDGEIVYSRGNTDLFAVPARGGERSTRFACPTGEHVHGPALLPDGRSVFFVIHRSVGPDTIGALIGERVERVYKIPGQRIGRVAWSPSGHFVFQRGPLDAGVWAAPFSIESRECGEAFRVAAGGGEPSVSNHGTLLYVPSAYAEQMQLGWVDRAGEWLGFAGLPERQLRFPRLSPDGLRVAATHRSQNSYDVWVQDLKAGTRSRLNFEPGFSSWMPFWSRDGVWIVGHKNATDPAAPVDPQLWLRRADGTGRPRGLGPGWAPSLSRDGKFVLFGLRDEDLSYAPLSNPQQRTVLVSADGEEREPEISPDDRFVAYVSNENGIWEIAMTQFPDGNGKWQISRGGGSKPRWNAAGDRLCFVHRNSLYEVPISTDPAMRIGLPRLVFEGDPLDLLLDEGYDVSPNDSHFLVIREIRRKGTEESAVLIEDWAGSLRGASGKR